MVASAVLSELARAGRTPQWLSEKTGIASHILEAKLAMQVDLTVSDLADIADALDLPVARLMPSVAGG